MKACARQWEAEAVRDGRLGEAEAGSFRRHAATCPSCARQDASLEALGAALRSLPPAGRDALAARRTRRAVLRRLDQEQLRPERRWPAWLPAALGAAALAALAVALWPSPRAVDVALSPLVEVVPQRHAVWSERRGGRRHEIVLESGEILVKVRRHDLAAEPLILRTPDAEIEDTGTVFSVQVENATTREVRVLEGSVSVRLRGAPPQTVQVGGRWLPPAGQGDLAPAAADSASLPPAAAAAGPPAAAAAAPPAAPSSPAPAWAASALPSAAAAAQAVGPVASGAAPAAARAASPPARSAARAASAASAEAPRAAEFEEAMALFRAGQYAPAAEGFASFAQRHPGDPRAEDAAYLRVLALARSGPQAAVQQAALGYLERFPGGLRVKEVRGLLR